jgi:hypothetical protein
MICLVGLWVQRGEAFVPKDYEKRGTGCFAWLDMFKITFEAGSRISVLGVRAFGMLHKLEWIHVVRSVETICDECFFQSSDPRKITFESGN